MDDRHDSRICWYSTGWIHAALNSSFVRVGYTRTSTVDLNWTDCVTLLILSSSGMVGSGDVVDNCRAVYVLNGADFNAVGVYLVGAVAVNVVDASDEVVGRCSAIVNSLGRVGVDGEPVVDLASVRTAMLRTISSCSIEYRRGVRIEVRLLLLVLLLAVVCEFIVAVVAVCCLLL